MNVGHRVQKVFISPDGAWSVAIYKIRGAPQYGFIALDLAKCEEQPPVELPSIASSASFEPGEVVLSLEKGEQRFKLKNQASSKSASDMAHHRGQGVTASSASPRAGSIRGRWKFR